MKYLQDNDGNTLPIPDEVQVFRRLVLFTNFSIAGDFSTDFNVPNNSETRATIGYYGLNQIEKLIQKPFHFFIDGNRLASGRVFIRSVTDTFDLFFIAGNGNWMNQITGDIKDIDFAQYNLPFGFESVSARMNATEGVIFPVIDWAYNYQKLTNYWHIKAIIGVSFDTYYDFYPCFYVKSLLKTLVNSYGYILAGNLLDDPIYDALVITPDQIKSLNYISPNPRNEFMISDSYDILVRSKIRMVSGSALFDSTQDAIIAPTDLAGGTATITFTLSTPTPNTFTFRIIRTPVIIATVSFDVTTIPTEFTVTVNLPAIDNGDIIYLEGDPIVTSRRFTIHQGRIDFNFDFNYIYVNDLLPSLSQFDFIKYVAQRFNCLLEFDDVTQTLTFTMLDKIMRDTSVDMSDRLSRYQQIPSSGYAARNYFRTKAAAELFNYKADNLNFGDKMIESDGDAEQDVLTTPFSPAESFTNANLEWLLTSIPLIRLEDADDGTAFTDVSEATGYVDSFIDGSSLMSIDVDTILRVESERYNGYIVSRVTNVAQVYPYGLIPYLGNDTGKLYKQKIVFNNAGSRELIVCRNVDINDINTGSQIYGNINLNILDNDNGSTVYPVDNISWAYFAKPNIGTPLDLFRIGLNYGDVLNAASIPFSRMYHKNFQSIIKGSQVKAYLLLTHVQYLSIDFKKFVFLHTLEFTGYFLIANIGGYQDQFTEVEIDLIYMDNG